MSPENLYRTIHQYSKDLIRTEDMKKLQEIAKDCCKVKNYVYGRYGGIGGLKKIYPGYTVQNEMTESGFREELGLPSVYFYLAIFDALRDIKGQWTKTKCRISSLAGRHEDFGEKEKHYLRFLLKTNNAFEAVLNQRQVQKIKLPKEIQKQYHTLAEAVDTEKMNRYLCRQVRKYHIRLHTEVVNGFSISERAYRYGMDGEQQGIYISTKESRKRIFVSLTDNNQYQCQLYIKLRPEESAIEIDIPVSMTVRHHEDYKNQVGLSMGMFTMLTTDAGHRYGEALGHYQTEYAEWMRRQTAIYHRNRGANPGRKKYEARKKRYLEQLHSYINHELNRFFQTEKPGTVYIVKLPHSQAGGVNRKINNSSSLWQRGYIRKRLALKCKEQSIEFIEVLGKDISQECSQCGAFGQKEEGIFVCYACGYRVEEKTNAARNAWKRGQTGRAIFGTR
ncbi:MAG: transposase [Lachnospiraceae bacterium]|nr:transposase [Lachnospiraceae bacterium]